MENAQFLVSLFMYAECSSCKMNRNEDLRFTQLYFIKEFKKPYVCDPNRILVTQTMST